MTNEFDLLQHTLFFLVRQKASYKYDNQMKKSSSATDEWCDEIQVNQEDFFYNMSYD